jgi:hypothetical protein
MTADEFVAEPALWRSVGKAALCGLVIGVVLELINLFAHADGSPVLLVGMPVACLVLLQLVRAGAAEAPLLLDPATGSSPVRSEYFVRLRQLERRLDRACADPANFDWSVRPMLVQLAVERLQAKHGVSAYRDPARAREIVGERLWQIMTTSPDTPSQPVSPAWLRELVQAISRI